MKKLIIYSIFSFMLFNTSLSVQASDNLNNDITIVDENNVDIDFDTSVFQNNEQFNALHNYNVLSNNIRDDLHGGMYIDGNILVVTLLEDNLNSVNYIKDFIENNDLIVDALKFEYGKYSALELETVNNYLANNATDLSISSGGIDVINNRLNVNIDSELNVVKRELIETNIISELYNKISATLTNSVNIDDMLYFNAIKGGVNFDDEGEINLAEPRISLTHHTVLNDGVKTSSVGFPFRNAFTTAGHVFTLGTNVMAGTTPLGQVKQITLNGKGDAAYIEFNPTTTFIQLLIIVLILVI
jgi:hypothetical protein